RLVRVAQRLALGAVLLPAPVLEVELGAVRDGPEADLEHRRGLRLRRRVPGDHEPVRRLPGHDLAPAALGAVPGDLDDPPAHAALEPDLRHVVAGYRVRGRGPPLADATGEQVERRLDGQRYRPRLDHGGYRLGRTPHLVLLPRGRLEGVERVVPQLLEPGAQLRQPRRVRAVDPARALALR